MRPIVGRAAVLAPANFGPPAREEPAGAAVSEQCVPLTRSGGTVIRTVGLITHRFKLDDMAGTPDALRGDRKVHKIILECWHE